MYRIRCGQIWGGISTNDVETATSSVTACLFSQACDGRKGGDIYYLSVCESDLLTRIAVADVMGHGNAVSQTSQQLYDSLESRMNNANGYEILYDLNRWACGYGFNALTTAIVCAYYLATRRFYYSYAGHHPVLVRRKDATRWEPAVLPETGELTDLPLGINDSMAYTQAELELDAGDRVFIYTDGLTEASSPDGELFGEQRLRAVLDVHGCAPLATVKLAVTEALKKHTGGTLSHDDVTFVVMEIHPSMDS